MPWRTYVAGGLLALLLVVPAWRLSERPLTAIWTSERASNWGLLARSLPEDFPSQPAHRYRSLAQELAGTQEVGYITKFPEAVIYSAASDSERLDVILRYYSAQFALAPTVLRYDQIRSWVVVDIMDPASARRIMKDRGLKLVRDLGPGLLLTQPGQGPEADALSSLSAPHRPSASDGEWRGVGHWSCLIMYAIAWALGCGLCRIVLNKVWVEVPTALRLGLGGVIGYALAGMTTFMAIVLRCGFRGAVVGVAALVFVAFVYGAVRYMKGPATFEPAQCAKPPLAQRIGSWFGVTAFIVVLVLSLIHQLDFAAYMPSGDWDAWAIWTLRARFLLLAPYDWTRGLGPALRWSHPGYPLLLPSLIVYGWLPAGAPGALAPAVVALSFHVIGLLLIVGLTQVAFRESAWPWALGIFYATVPQEWDQALAWEYADRPLAVFLLAGAGCVALAFRQHQKAWLFVAGLSYGAACFCKDEGKAAVAALALCVGLTVLFTRRRASHACAWRSTGLFALGAAPGLVCLAAQTIGYPLAPDLIAPMTVVSLVDMNRALLILRAFAGRLCDPSWGGFWWGCGLTLLGLLPWLRRREVILLWSIVAAQLVVYLIVFQLTPVDLLWHLETALPRLLLHVGPIALLAAGWSLLEAKTAAESERSARDKGVP